MLPTEEKDEQQKQVWEAFGEYEEFKKSRCRCDRERSDLGSIGERMPELYQSSTAASCPMQEVNEMMCYPCKIPGCRNWQTDYYGNVLQPETPKQHLYYQIYYSHPDKYEDGTYKSMRRIVSTSFQ